MQGSLGEKIGEGAFSDVHAWAPAQVVKLFKSGTPRRLSWREARVTRAVFAAGAAGEDFLLSNRSSGAKDVVPAGRIKCLDHPTTAQARPLLQGVKSAQWLRLS
jgi:hypothetical protein